MPPTSKKLVGHIASGAFVTLFDAYHNFRNVHATILKFLIWIPHEKIAERIFFFSAGLCPYPELLSFEKNMDTILLSKYLKNY